jgi:hypothetical protein
VLGLTEAYDRMTVRQIFYQLESQGIVEKTEGGYRQVLKQVLKLRRANALPWSFISDGTRLQRKPSTFSDAGDYVEQMARQYRRNLWQYQIVRLEVWLEKDALADLVSDVTRQWDVALMVSRGQSSATFLHSAAMVAADAWAAGHIYTQIYALYDFDAGGMRGAKAVEHELPSFAPQVPIFFTRLGVTQQQIHDWKLPTRPAKRSDPEAKKFAAEYGSEAVELDAIPPDRLKGLVEDAITDHVDQHAWEVEQAIEAQELDGLRALADGWS